MIKKRSKKSPLKKADAPWLEYMICQNPGKVQSRTGLPAPNIIRLREKLENREAITLTKHTKNALRQSYKRTMYTYLKKYGMSTSNAKRWAGYPPKEIMHQVKIQHEFIQVRSYRQNRAGIKTSPDKIRQQMQRWQIVPQDIEKWNESPKLKKIAKKLMVLSQPQIYDVELRGKF